MDPLLSGLIALRPLREPSSAQGRAARQALERGAADTPFEWVVDAQRAMGWAPHPSDFLPLAVALSNAAIKEAVDDLKWFRVLRLPCVEAAFEGYALAAALTGVEGRNTGKAFKRAADSSRFIKTAVRAGDKLRESPTAALAAELVAHWKRGVPAEAQEAGEAALWNALAAGMLLHQHEHGSKHAALAALKGEKSPRSAPARTAPEAPELIDAILGAPDDDRPRLVYADWLTEQGDPRGEFIQVQCTLGRTIFGSDHAASRTGEKSSSIKALELREIALLKKHEKQWLEGLRYFREWHWRRGFVSSIIGKAADFLSGAGPLSRVPLEAAELSAYVPALKALVAAAQPHPTLRAVDFSRNRLTAKTAGVLSTPFFSRLRQLDLAENDFSDPASIRSLFTLTRLERLRLTATHLARGSLEALAAAPFFPQLTHLSLSMNEGLDSTVVDLLAGARKLEWLDLSRVTLDDRVAEALLARGFRYLDVSGPAISKTVKAELARRYPARPRFAL